MWIITDVQGNTITVADLGPDAVAYDESGFQVDLDDLEDGQRAAALADDGYFGRDQRRILIWANEEDSVDDPGTLAIASAVWSDEAD